MVARSFEPKGHPQPKRPSHAAPPPRRTPVRPGPPAPAARPDRDPPARPSRAARPGSCARGSRDPLASRPQKLKSGAFGSPIGQRQVCAPSAVSVAITPGPSSLADTARRTGVIFGRWGFAAAGNLAGRTARTWAGREGAGRPLRPRRWILPITALRVTPPSALAICDALWPSRQSRVRVVTRSSDQPAWDIGTSSRRAHLERTRPGPSSASGPRRYIRPWVLKLTTSSPPTRKWSWTRIPSARPASTTLRVMSMSAEDGVGFPVG
jgi:hypothetical protein